MGALEQQDVRAYADAASCMAERPGREVGSILRRAPVDLTRVSKRDGEWIFSDEIAADVYAYRRSIETAAGEVSFWRLEVLVEGPREVTASKAMRLGDMVSVAEFPWSSSWVARAALKGPNDEGKTRVGEQWGASLDAVIAGIDELSVDPFLTDKRYLVAGFTDPGIAIDSESTREQRGVGRYVFGVCREFEEAVADLMSDAELLHCIDAAVAGRLIDKSVKGGGNLVPEGARDRDAIHAVMALAIQQAFAGPARARDLAVFLCQPMRRLAKQIFIEHLSRLRKLTLRSRAPKTARATSRGLAPRDAAWSSAPDRETMIALIEQRLADNAKDRRAFARLLVDQNLHLLLAN